MASQFVSLFRGFIGILKQALSLADMHLQEHRCCVVCFAESLKLPTDALISLGKGK